MMFINSKIESLGAKIGEYYSGSLYEQGKFSLFGLFSKILSRVKIDEDYVEKVRELSREGIVVYALKNKSQLNSLILWNICNRYEIKGPDYCHGIRMILWQPFLIALRAIPSSVFHNPYKREYLKKITKDKKSSIIYLRDSEFIGSKYSKDPLVELIKAQKELYVPVFVVPETIAYSRKREMKEKSWLNILFGEEENPGMVRRLITFFRFSKRAFVVSSEAINLAEFIAEHKGKSLDSMSYLLRRELIERIDSEKRSIVGPILKSREEIISMVLRDGRLVEDMKNVALSEKKDYKEVVKEAKKYLYEIASDYAEAYISMLERLLTWLWNNIYDGIVIDREGLARIREVSKKTPFVVIPCHRSHIDYLILSYVFYHNKIPMPFVAAGTNMLFWPFGYIFRKAGAFFLRRSFRGNYLYGQVFAKYIKILLQEGLPVEFFIEGGRSRTGKMVMPKYGLLSMVIQAFRESYYDDLAIIPVFIGYDRVIEEKSYLKELDGGKKVREKTSSLIKSRKILKKRYGSVYLNIGEPIMLKSYLEAQDKYISNMTTDERRSLYRKMGYHIADRINKISVVTPFSLVAAGLLSHYKRGISHNDLMHLLDEFYDYLDHRNVRFSYSLANREKALNNALDLFESSGLISKMGIEEDKEDEFEEIIYSIEEEGKRLTLEYYKNNIMHFLVSLSFVATSILSNDGDEIPLSGIIEDYRFFKRLFWHEFIFDDNIDDVEEVNEVLTYIHDKGMIVGHENDGRAWIEVKGKGRINLMPFASLISNYIESYWITIRGCSYLKNRERQEKDLIRKIHKLGIKMYKKGEVSKAEALSQSNYRNALSFLADAEVINVSYGKDEGEKKKKRKEKERDTKILSLTERKDRIESLRRQLFRFMG